jgi:hypothetical protein
MAAKNKKIDFFIKIDLMLLLIFLLYKVVMVAAEPRCFVVYNCLSLGVPLAKS